MEKSERSQEGGSQGGWARRLAGGEAGGNAESLSQRKGQPCTKPTWALELPLVSHPSGGGGRSPGCCRGPPRGQPSGHPGTCHADPIKLQVAGTKVPPSVSLPGSARPPFRNWGGGTEHGETSARGLGAGFQPQTEPGPVLGPQSHQARHPQSSTPPNDKYPRRPEASDSTGRETEGGH